MPSVKFTSNPSMDFEAVFPLDASGDSFIRVENSQIVLVLPHSDVMIVADGPDQVLAVLHFFTACQGVVLHANHEEKRFADRVTHAIRGYGVDEEG